MLLFRLDNGVQEDFKSDSKKIFSRFWILGLIFSLLLLLGLTAKPLWHWLQSVRSYSITERGMKAVEAKQWELAFQQADLGLQLNPHNEMGWRIMARVYSEARMDRALFYWQELEKRKQLTQEDRGFYLDLLLVLKRFDLAAVQWEHLLPLRDHLSQREILLGVDYYRLTQKSSEAIALLRNAKIQKESQNRFLLGQFLIQESNRELRKEGEGILRNLAQREEEVGIHAAEFLLGSLELSDSEFLYISKLIERHPLYTFRSQLSILENEIRREPRQHSNRIEKLFLEWNKGPQREEERILLGQWLNRQKRFDLTLKLISDSLSKNSSALIYLRLDAAAAQKNWILVLETLTLQPSPLEPYLGELFRARALAELKRTRDSEAAWEKTFHLVKYQPLPLQFVADYAVQIGDFKQAKRLYLQMSRFPNYALESQRQLLYLAEKEENLIEMTLRLEKILELSPDSLAAQNDLAYMKLLQNQDLDRSLQSSESLVKQDPSSLAYRSTLALCNLKKGRPLEAFKVYQGLTIDWNTASLVARWIFYITLKANREEELAKRFEPFVKGIALRQPEKELIQLIPSSQKR